MVFKYLLILPIYVIACCTAGQFATILLRSIICRGGCRGATQDSIHWGLDFAFGTALLSVIWLFLGLVGLLHSEIVWLVVIALVVIGFRSYFENHKTWPSFASLSCLYKPSAGALIAMLIVSIGALALWSGVLAFVRPPFGDADAFYMTYPKIIAATGRLEAMAGGYRDFSSIGLSGELHFAALMAIGTPALAKVFAWTVGIGTLILLKDVIRLVGGGGMAQVVGMAILITSSAFSDYLSDGKTDLFAALLGFAAVYSVLLVQRTCVSIEYIVIAGLMTGFAIVAKFSFLVVFFPAMFALVTMRLMVWPTVWSRTPKLSPSTIGYLLVFVTSVFVGLIPHLLKNQVLFENALAPFLGMGGNWANQPSWYSVPDTAWIVVTYPFALVYGLYPLMGGNISFLWLAALPLIFLFTREDFTLQNPVMQLSLAACLGIVCWLVVKPSIFAPRYILATLMLLIPLPALAVERMRSFESRPKVVTLGYCFLVVAALGSVPFTAPAGVWTALPEKIWQHIRSGAPDCGLAISSYCAGFNAINDRATRGERLFLAGYYSFQLRPDLLQCINEPDDYKLFNKSSPENVWSALYSQGYAYVAVQKATHGQLLNSLDLRLVPSWLSVSVESADTDMPIFSIHSLQNERQPEVSCVPQEDGTWKVTANPQW
jgi:hypothetical protein